LKDNIKKLIMLQKCDNKIKAIQTKRDLVPVRIKKLEETFEETSSIYKSRFDKLESLEKERRALEKDVQDIESRAAKSQDKLSHIKSNKEYTAALKEIAEIEKEKGKKEDQILQMMEEIESLKAECNEIKGEQEKLKGEFDEEKKEIENELLELDKEVEELMTQRTGYNDAVDQKILKTYDMLRDRRAGVAVSSVVSGICQGCHLEIPPQKYNELQRCNEMMSCPHCNRLIYWGDDEFFVKILSE
jgi:uncharacterized protein